MSTNLPCFCLRCHMNQLTYKRYAAIDRSCGLVMKSCSRFVTLQDPIKLTIRILPSNSSLSVYLLMKESKKSFMHEDTSRHSVRHCNEIALQKSRGRGEERETSFGVPICLPCHTHTRRRGRESSTSVAATRQPDLKSHETRLMELIAISLSAFVSRIDSKLMPVSSASQTHIPLLMLSNFALFLPHYMEWTHSEATAGPTDPAPQFHHCGQEDRIQVSIHRISSQAKDFLVQRRDCELA